MRIYDDDYCVSIVQNCIDCARAGDYSGCRQSIELGLKHINERSGEPIDPIELLSVIVGEIRKFGICISNYDVQNFHDSGFVTADAGNFSVSSATEYARDGLIFR